MTDPSRAPPAIAVVVPSLNQAEFLDEALASLFGQRYPHLEVVVMDGGSTDGSRAVLERHAPRLHYWQSARDGGQSAAINAGLRRCGGELVAWLNSDDLLCDDALWTIADAYRAHPGRGLYIGMGLRRDELTGVNQPFDPRGTALSRAELARWTFGLQQPSVFFSREAWDEAGGVDERLVYCMDWDLVLRIAARHAAVNVPAYLSVAREHDRTKTQCGGLQRAAEIVAMLRARTGQDLTLGGYHYVLETVIALAEGRLEPALTTPLRRAAELTFRAHGGACARGPSAAQTGEGGDVFYVPHAAGASARPESAALSIALGVMGAADVRSRDRTLASIAAQRYASVEVVQIDADGDRALAALAHGLTRAGGELHAVLRAGEMLAQGALSAASVAFARDPGLELVYGDALWVDSNGELAAVDLGPWSGGYWRAGAPELGDVLGTRALGLAAPRAAVMFRPARVGLSDAADPQRWLRRLGAAVRVERLDRVQALLPATGALLPAQRLGRATWGELRHRGLDLGGLLRRLVGHRRDR